MQVDPSQIEPVSEKCDNCMEIGFQNNIRIPSADTVDVFCLECLLDQDIERDVIEEIILMEVENGNVTEEEYDSYEVVGAFGAYLVRFDRVDENKEVYAQKTVDSFKQIGSYTELKGRGMITILKPGKIETEFTTKAHRDSINEEREERAVNSR